MANHKRATTVVMVDCPEHEDCVAIYLPATESEGVEWFDRRVVWVSHATTDLAEIDGIDNHVGRVSSEYQVDDRRGTPA